RRPPPGCTTSARWCRGCRSAPARDLDRASSAAKPPRSPSLTAETPARAHHLGSLRSPRRGAAPLPAPPRSRHARRPRRSHRTRGGARAWNRERRLTHARCQARYNLAVPLSAFVGLSFIAAVGLAAAGCGGFSSVGPNGPPDDGGDPASPFTVVQQQGTDPGGLSGIWGFTSVDVHAAGDAGLLPAYDGAPRKPGVR